MREGEEVIRDPRAQERGLWCRYNGMAQRDGIQDLAVSPSSVLEHLLLPDKVLRRVDGWGSGGHETSLK